MGYKDIKTPKQLIEFMTENIKYGLVDEDGNIYGAWNNKEFQEACWTKWKLSSPERLMKVKYGHCLDQVELERNWFLNHGYPLKTFYIGFAFPYDNIYSNHAYLVFEAKGKYYYFEHSDYKNRGIHEFPTYENAIQDQKEKYIAHNQQRKSIGPQELQYLYIYEYEQPIYGCTRQEWKEYILKNAKKVENTKDNIEGRVEYVLRRNN